MKHRKPYHKEVAVGSRLTSKNTRRIRIRERYYSLIIMMKIIIIRRRRRTSRSGNI
jgi:hypothetical protein